MRCRCAAECSWTVAHRGAHLPATALLANDRLQGITRSTPPAILPRVHWPRRQVQSSAPLKLSACDCCSSANKPQSIVTMAKSKDKQTKGAKAAPPSITATKKAFDPTLSSLFASSVRAELFRHMALRQLTDSENSWAQCKRLQSSDMNKS